MTRVLTNKKRRPSSALVTQSNRLVSARYAMSLGEMRLLFTVVAKVQPSDTKFTVYRIPVAEFASFLNVDKNSTYREMKKITKSLVTRYVEIKEPGSLIQTTWVAQAKYVDGTGMVEVQLSESMIPYLLQLKSGNFTQYKLTMLLSFKSQYTLRFYMLLKQKRDHNPWAEEYEFELSELRKQLGLSVEGDKSRKVAAVELYAGYKNFKARVLNPAKNEMDEKSDLSFEYREIKQGRSVVALSFKVSSISSDVIPKDDGQLDLELIDQPTKDLDFILTLLSFVPEPHRTKKGVRTAIEKAEKQHGFDYVKRNILYTNAHAEKNYSGYLSGALSIDYGHDWEIEQQQAAKAAEQVQKSVSVQELNNLAEEIRALQRNSKLTSNPEMWQQAEALKAEYARKLEIYEAENINEEEEEVATP